MHVLQFYCDTILYMFRIGKLLIFRVQFYCTAVYGMYGIMHYVDWLLPRSRWNCLLKVNCLPIRNMYRVFSE